MKDMIKILCIAFLIMGFVTITTCSSPLNSTFPTKEQIAGRYQSDDASNVIVVSENSFEYERTFTGKEGNFTFNISSPNWEVKNHPLKFECYVVTVSGNMSVCSLKEPINSNIKSGATTLTFIVRMVYSNGKQTGKIEDMLLPTDEERIETCYRKQ